MNKSNILFFTLQLLTVFNLSISQEGLRNFLELFQNYFRILHMYCWLLVIQQKITQVNETAGFTFVHTLADYVYGCASLGCLTPSGIVPNNKSHKALP